MLKVHGVTNYEELSQCILEMTDISNIMIKFCALAEHTAEYDKLGGTEYYQAKSIVQTFEDVDKIERLERQVKGN